MPWFKVDDKLHDHRKVRAAGVGAMGLWVMAGSWSADNLTNGFVPAAIVTRWGRGAVKLAAVLVQVGLWEVASIDGEPGWQYHAWAEYQPTRADVEKERSDARERMAKARAAKRGGSAELRPNNFRTSGEVRITPTRPDPTVTTEVSSNGASASVTNASANNVHNIQDEPRSKSYPAGIWKLARNYAAKVNPSDPSKIAAHIVNATATWELDTIAKAVDKMAAEGRGLSADSLRIELNQIGCDKTGIQRFSDGTTIDWNTGITRTKTGDMIGGGGYRSGKVRWSDG